MANDEANQGFATARDDQIDQLIQGQQFVQQLTVRVIEHGQQLLGQPCRLEGGLQAAGNRLIAVARLLATAQHAGIAGFQAERRRIGGDVGPRLVDHRDQP